MSAINRLFAALQRLFTWWVTIAPWERAVRVRLGKHVKLLGPGIHWNLPAIDRIYRQSVRQRVAVMEGQTTTTKDGHAVTVSGVLGYRIGHLLRLYDTLHHAEATIQNMAEAEVSQYLNTHRLEESTPEKLQRAVNERLDFERFGLADANVRIIDFASVKTYRFVTGPINRYHSGDQLQTSMHEQVDNGSAAL